MVPDSINFKTIRQCIEEERAEKYRKIENRIEQITLSAIECWNDLNPKEKLNPSLIRIFQNHIKMAFVVSQEDYKKELKSIIESISTETGQVFQLSLFNKIMEL